MLLKTVGLLLVAHMAQAKIDVFVMGDSQIGYDHHVGFENFFNNPKVLCGENYSFDKITYAGYGASGSGFHHWLEEVTESEQYEHGQICNMSDEKKWFGSDLDGSVDENYEDVIWGNVCLPGKTPLDKVLDFKPKVVVASFLGAHSSQDETEITEAIDNFEKHLPQNVECIVITSPPLVDADRALKDLELNTEGFVNKMKKDFLKELKYYNVKMKELKSNLVAQGKDYKTDEEYKRLAAELKFTREQNVDEPDEIWTDFSYWQEARGEAAEIIHNVVLKNRRCQLVKGFDDIIMKEVAGDLANYLDEDELKNFQQGYLDFDPFHLSPKGSLKFFQVKKAEICAAFAHALR